MGGAEKPGVDTSASDAVATFWMVVMSGLLASLLFLRRDGDRLRWYRVVYWLAYRLGLTVWRRPRRPTIWLLWWKDPRRYLPDVPWIWAAAPAPTPSTWPPTAGKSPASIRCPKRWPPRAATPPLRGSPRAWSKAT